MKRTRLLLLTLLLLGVQHLFSQSSQLPPVIATYAITNATIVQAPGKQVEQATIVIKDGIIQAVGKDVTIPPEAHILEGDSMFVYAGFIDALSHVGIPEPKAANEGQRPSAANPTYEQAGIQPHQLASTLLNVKEKSIENARKVGITLAHAVPKGQMLPGMGALILTHGEDVQGMVFKDGTSLFSQFRGANRVYPSTVIAVMSKYRELYKQAIQQKNHQAAYAKNPAGMPRPGNDQVLSAFYPVIDGQLPVFFAAKDVKSAYRALALQQDLKFPMVLANVQQGWHMMDVLKSRKIPVVLSVELPKDPKKGKVDSTKTKSPEMEKLEKRRDEALKKHIAQAGSFEKANIDFGFSMLSAKPADLRGNLRKMIEHGLSEEGALAALTTTPASMLGVSGSLGTVEKGKIANLVVTDKSYFAEKSNIRYVLVDGHPYEYEVKKPKKKGDSKGGPISLAGTWSYKLEAMGREMTGRFEFTQDGDDYAGKAWSSTSPQSIDLIDISVDGKEVTFNSKVEMGGQSFSMSYNLIIDGESFEGSINMGDFGTYDMEGAKTSVPK